MDEFSSQMCAIAQIAQGQSDVVSVLHMSIGATQLQAIISLTGEIQTNRKAIERQTKAAADEAKIRCLQNALTNSGYGSFEYLCSYNAQSQQLSSNLHSRDLVASAIMTFLRDGTFFHPHGYVSATRDVTADEALAARAMFHTKLCEHLHGLTGKRPRLTILDDERFELSYV